MDTNVLSMTDKLKKDIDDFIHWLEHTPHAVISRDTYLRHKWIA